MPSTITSWGRYPKVDAREVFFESQDDLAALIEQGTQFIPRGNARSYGDSSLNDIVATSTRRKKIIDFDTKSGIIKCESGLLFSEILDFIVPKGWFLPVTPGTKFITVGGAIASDVHGKNHHKDGSFSNHMLDFELLCADGKIRTCSKTQNADIFSATCGGMGLTGIILEARFQTIKIESAFIKQLQVKAENLDEILDLFEKYEGLPYTMAWIDCLKSGRYYGRSILIAGDHAKKSDLSAKQETKLLKPTGKGNITMPFNLPSFTLNTWSIKAFNA